MCFGPTTGRNCGPLGGGASTTVLLSLGAVGLTLINALQLGADPLTDAAEGADIAAITTEGATAAAEEVGVDANPLIRSLDYGESDKLSAALAGRAPVVSPQAASEYLAGGDAGRFADFLASNGGRIGSQVTDEEAAALRSQANSLTDQFGNARALGYGDSYVVGSAMQDNVPLITQDGQVIRFLRAISYPVEPF